MKIKKWHILIILILSGIIITGFVRNYQHSTQNAVDEAAILAKLQEEEVQKQEEERRLIAKAEAEKKEAERIHKEKEAAEAKAAALAKLKDIEANTYYVWKDGADLFDQPNAQAIVISKLEAKMPLYVSEVLKDENGEFTYFKVKETIDSPESLGYVSSASVVKQLTDFIARPVADVDYNTFLKNGEFESNPKRDVKGIFVTGSSASGSRLDELIQLIDETELNAVVIDVKDDNGYLLFKSEAADRYCPEANDHYYIDDIEAFIQKLKAHDIYAIARIVTFKSPIYAKNNPDRAIVNKTTQKLYSDADGLIWASPHDRTLWEYNVAIAKEAAKIGFDEVQFDYVRFPAISKPEMMDFRNPTAESQSAAIQNFLKYAYAELTPYEVYVSADVFGWAASAINDVGIGQHWESVSNVVDYICPMMYPSHYGSGNYGLEVPDAFPFETIDRSVKDALSRNRNIYTPGSIRPWIQDFTATWVKGHIRYRAPEVKAQIEALKANGISEYLVWNAGNFYSKDAFK